MDSQTETQLSSYRATTAANSALSAVPLNTLTPCRPRELSAHKALPEPQAAPQSLPPAGPAAGEPAPQQPASAATVAPAVHVTAAVHDVC